MRGAGIRGIGALVAAAVAASCGWPEFAFDPKASDDGTSDDGEDGGAGASEPTGGSSGVAGASGGRAGASGNGGTGGASVPDTCNNGMRDLPETGVDCGGGTCPGCPPGGPCVVALDCAERTYPDERIEDGFCTHGVCEALFCRDLEASGSETDEDCGGPDCDLRCAPGQECREGPDCDSLLCQDGRCVTPECEPISGPCGSSDCPCANGRGCALHDDCASGNCAGGTCAEGPRVFSRNDEPDAENLSTPAILQAFLVRNDAPSEIPLGELSLRYYFNNDGLGEPRARCDESRAVDPDVCIDVRASVFELIPAALFADTYAEVSLPDGELLTPGGITSEVPIAVEPPAGGLYEQGTDYSFAANVSLAENRYVTLYRRGVLIWGREPR